MDSSCSTQEVAQPSGSSAHSPTLSATMSDSILRLQHLMWDIGATEDSPYVDGALRPLLRDVRNCAPTIFIYGAQSTSKSTLLNYVCFEGRQILSTGRGTTTLCPTELQLGPHWKKTEFFICQRGTLTSCASLNDAQAQVKVISDKKIWSEGKIICRANASQSLTLVDLPGVTNDNASHIQTLVEGEWIRSNVLVIHVVLSHQDAETDQSFNLLQKLNPPYILRVFSQFDTLKVHPEAIKGLLSPNTPLAMFSKKDDYVDNFQAYSAILPQLDPHNAIYGPRRIAQYIINFLEHNLSKGEFSAAKLQQIELACDSILNSIGHTSPPMAEIYKAFQTTLEKMVENHWKLPRHFGAEYANIGESISSTQLSRIIHAILPEKEDLRQDIIHSSVLLLPGSSGWHEQGMSYLAMAYDDTFKTYLKPALQRYKELYSKLVVESCQYGDHSPYANAALHDFGLFAMAQLDTAFENLENDVKRLLERDKVYPVLDTSTMLNYDPTIVLGTIFYRLAQKQSNIFQLHPKETSPEAWGEILMKDHRELLESNIYMQSAVQMRETLLGVWSRLVISLHQDMLKHVRHRTDNLKQSILEYVKTIDPSLICESESIVQRRLFLLRLKQLCIEASQCINE